MTPFCNDIDLLHWEPNLLREAAFASQTLMSGTADLSGVTLSIESGSFVSSHIEANQVVSLGGSINGCFPIVSIESATSLTLSVLYDKLFPDDGDPEPSPVGAASDVPFVIRTFWPQRRVVSEILQQAAGIIPGDPRTANTTILNPEALRRPCLLGTLQLIYSALSAAADAPEEYAVRADLYERLFRLALRSTSVELDRTGDGKVTTQKPLSATQMFRK